MAIDLLVIGDTNFDLLLQVPRFPQEDDEVKVERYLRMPGGDAANLSAAAARLA
jgi:sugar/nucleoside kinase (ribokinase family)